MDARLVKQWAVTEKLLRDAMAELPEQDPQVLDFLAHNEFGLALGDLVVIGRDSAPSSKFWRLLRQATSLMGPNKHRVEIRRRYREAMEMEMEDNDGDAQRT